MKYLSTVLLMSCLLTIGFAQDIKIGKRDSLYSKVLGENRPFSVYLPPSYNTSVNQKYPVLYILDGDYNFQYVAGLLELQGGISEFIPETILIAISGKGSTEYRKNCKPNIEGIVDKGNADEVADFIENELIPYVNSHYKAANFKILAGHSVGGLFVINTALNHPSLFNHYIAISPALWWADNAINKVAKEIISENKEFQASVYISLANEKGMGVDKFLTVVEKATGNKSSKLFPFKKFENENHNSVGEPTYKWALKDIFKEWRVEKEFFSSAAELKSHYDKVSSAYGSTFNIPTTYIGYTHYTLKDKEKELQLVQEDLKSINPNAYVNFNTYRAGKLIEEDTKQAEILVNEAIELNPNSFDSYNILAKIKLFQGELELADSLSVKSIEMAKKYEARQWQMNELEETHKQIKERLNQ
ncbi:MAG TPA: alpha/beta hydrolase-fold protein [Fulvivirga sp.]|nr:alpha/beta hydrolase-fold protein [Fulvivirga sp.]